MIDKQIYNPEQCPNIFNFLDTLEVEYHKPYKRFNQIVKVPRGQASYTLDESIYYDYKVSGGSPPNYIMCPQLKEITARVNEALDTNFNTILLNKYNSAATVSERSRTSLTSAAIHHTQTTRKQQRFKGGVIR